MQKKYKKIISMPFIRNVVILSSGAATAQFVNMLFSPLLTRLFGPEAYGIMGTFSAITSIFIPVAALSYPISIVLPDDENEAKSLVKLSLRITSLSTSLIFLLVFFFNREISIIFNITNISSYLFLIPLVIFFAGISQTFEQWLIRKQEFRLISKVSISEALLINVSKFLSGLILPIPSVLVIFTTLKRGVQALLFFVFNYKEFSRLTNTYKVRNKELFELANKYRDFPLFRAPHQFLNSITSSLPSLFLTTFFGPTVTGFYSIGRTLLGVPSFLIGKSVGDVFYPQISKAANRNKRITPLIIRSTKYLGFVGALPYVVIIITGPWLFAIVFGSEWYIAGEYARWLAVWIFTDFLRLPSINTLPILTKQNLLLVYTVLLLIMQSGAFLVGYYVFNNDMVAVALFSVVGAVFNIVLIFMTVKICKEYDNQIINDS